MCKCFFFGLISLIEISPVVIFSTAVYLSHFQNPQSLLDIDGTLFKMALTTSYTIETQRAGLHFLTTLCEKSEFPRDVLIIVLDNLLQSMSSVRADDRKPLDTLLINKVSLDLS